MDLLDDLNSGGLIADGSIAAALNEAGVPLPSCLEQLSLDAPDAIRRVHQDYIDAGARVIASNTYSANRVKLATHGLESKVNETNWSAMQVARQCAKGKGVYVAGAVGPLGVTHAEAKERGIDRAAVFVEQIGALLDSGAQMILLKGFRDIEELILALEAKQALHHCPAVCSVAPGADGSLEDGTPLLEGFKRLWVADADVVGVDQIDDVDEVTQLFKELASTEHVLSAFPNTPRQETPEGFTRAGVALARNGVKLIGGCAGVGPAHIACLAEALR